MIKAFKKFICCLSVLNIHFQGIAYCNLQSELDHVLDSFNSSSSTSSAEIYNTQRAGYATGGGLTMRNRLYNSKIGTVTMPKIDAGCGGIDIFMGGFSFINSDELVATLKDIGAASKGYAFMLGVEAVSPMISSNMSKLQSWANTINGMSINSCEHAQGLVGSILPRNNAIDEHICNSLSTTNQIYRDFIEARRQCSKKPRSKEIEMSAAKEGILLDYNIAWEAIKKHVDFSNDTKKAELIMSLMGTIIIKKNEDGNGSAAYYPSKVNDENFLNNLMKGGKITLLSCKGEKGSDAAKQCLVVKENMEVISEGDAWVGKTKTKLMAIQEKALSDSELTPDEISFISRSRLPLYKIVNALGAKKRSFATLDLVQLSEYVAKDMLSCYLREIINLVRAGCQEIRAKQFYGEQIDQYLNDLTRVETSLNEYEVRTRNQYATEADIMRNIQFLEEQIFSEINLN